MHGFWLVLILPVAALVAWKVGGSRWQKFAGVLTGLTGFGLLIWMAVVGIAGTELTESIADRIWHSIGTVVVSIGFPLVQLLLGCLLISCWPSSDRSTANTMAVSDPEVPESQLDSQDVEEV